MIFEDIESSLEEFENFNQFFTRSVKTRSYSLSDDHLIVPADSKVLSIEQVTGNDVVIVKNVTYSLGNFLTGKFN